LTSTSDVVVFNVLGPWEVVRGQSPVAVPHGRLAVLLAALLMSLDRPVSIDSLVEKLWPEGDGPVRPQQTLYTYVNRLRALLGPDVIETSPGGRYRLRVAPHDVDLYRFRDLLTQAAHADSTDEERQLLRAGLRLWRGSPFGDVPSTWLDREVIPRLTEEWLAASERRIDLDLVIGPPGPVVAELWELTSRYPTRESLWIRLVRALRLSGRRADAVDAYQKAKDALREELGVEPGEQLARLGREVVRESALTGKGEAADATGELEPEQEQAQADVTGVDFAETLRTNRTRLGWTQAELAEQAGVSERTVQGLESGRSRPRLSTARLLAKALRLEATELESFILAASRLPTMAALSAPSAPREAALPAPAQLPPDIGDFVGRASELAMLDELLPVEGDTAVAVLSGTAGVGKTALAIRWAHHVEAEFPDGQLYANLRGFSTGRPVPPVEVLAEFLGALGLPAGEIPPKQDAAAALYRSSLADRRMLVVLDNALDADQVRPLLPSGSGSIVLVTSRHVLNGLVVSHGARQQTLAPLPPTEAIELVTRILGADRVAAEPEAADGLVAECAGLPLALRIAAANVRVEEHLDIAEYVAELRSGDRLTSLAVGDDPAASVRVAFDWSYERLSPPVQRLFRYLSLMPGPDVTAEAAAALTGTHPGQTRWWLRSLAEAHLLDRSGPRRYALHDLLRAYSAERAQAVEPESERDAAIGRLLDWYLHSMIAALEMLAPTAMRLPTPPADPGLPLVRPADRTEAGNWLAAERRSLVAAVTFAAANGRNESAWLLADALRGYFESDGNRVDWTVVAQTALAAAEAEGDPAAGCAARSSLAHVHHISGEYDEALREATLALTLAREAGWLAGEARVLNHLAVLHAESGDLDGCVDLFRTALELDRRAGDRVGQAKRLMNLGIATWSGGRLREALDYLRQAVHLLGAKVHDDITLANLGHLLHHTGDLAAAENVLNEAVAAHAENAVTQSYALVMLAELCLDQGRLTDADTHADAAIALVDQASNQVSAFWAGNMRAYVDIRLGRLGVALQRLEALLREVGDQGYLSVRCSALASLAEAQCGLGRLDLAQSNAEQSLKLAESAGRRVLESEALSVQAQIHFARYQRDGDPSTLDEAAAVVERTLELQRWMGHPVGEARSLILLGDIAQAAGEPDAAVEHWQAALTICAEIGLVDAAEVRDRLRSHR
jgi:DNA-binding SARP family transcriptional activator/tetratricopeptide (TPR) repeat protein/transcriptional regulator with XRE-family HTH domain